MRYTGIMRRNISIIGSVAFLSIASFLFIHSSSSYLEIPSLSTVFEPIVTAQSASLDWPQIQHDAQHTGYVADTYSSPYTLLWRFDIYSNPLPPPVSNRVQPVVAYNYVYLPSDDGKLYAVKTADGKV